jgi:hypothetical protein
VIPARNEAPTIGDLVTRSRPFAHRVVVMDGHSTDGTPDIARAAGATVSVSLGQLIRTIGNISMNIAINTRWKVALTDTLNGYRAVRRSAALAVKLVEDRHTIEQEMVMKMLRHRFRVGNAPTHEYARLHGHSHINIWREWPKFVWCVVENLVPRDLPPRAARPEPAPRRADPQEVGVPGL